MSTDDGRTKPTHEILSMSAGELVHHMLINFMPPPRGANVFECAYYAQNVEYMQAHDRLNEILRGAKNVN